MKPEIILYVAVMAGVTYLIRMIPFAAFRKKVKSRFIRSFLAYVPYAVLSAMTIPWVLESTGDALSAGAGFAVAVVLSYKGFSLLTAALSASLAAFVVGLL